MNRHRLASICGVASTLLSFATLLASRVQAGECWIGMYVVCSKTADVHRRELCGDLRRRLKQSDSVDGVCWVMVYDDDGAPVFVGKPDYADQHSDPGEDTSLLVTIDWGSSDQFKVDLFSCGTGRCNLPDKAGDWRARDPQHQLSMTARLLHGDKVKLVNVSVPNDGDPDERKSANRDAKAIRRAFRPSKGLSWRSFYRATLARWANSIESAVP